MSEYLRLGYRVVHCVIVRRITNLKYWGRSETIISKTLQLLNDLSVGYSCVRKLVKLDEASIECLVCFAVCSKKTFRYNSC